MKNFFERAFKEIRLKSRFAARKVGFSRWQVHQISLPELKLIYIPIPKNACTSVKQALHQIEFGREFDRIRPINDPYGDVHDYYKKRADAFTSVQHLHELSDHTCFTIIRDPLERMISCYRNRVVDLEDLKQSTDALKKMKLPVKPDLNCFVLNLKKYRQASKNIEHHSRPQASFLGDTLSYLDHVYTIERIGDLFDWLQTVSPGFTMLSRKSGGTSVDLSELSDKALRYAIRFYRKDYELLRTYYETPDSSYINR